MLYRPMKWIGAIALCSSLCATAQVEIDVPIRATGPEGQRGINGLGDPINEGAAISVDVASSGQVHWASGTVTADTLTLSVSPGLTYYQDGQLLRFSAVGNDQVMPWIRVGGMAALPVVRSDGLAVQYAPLGSGTVAEILLHAGTWILLNADRATCPPGSVSVNERLCMETNATSGLKIYQAIARCGDRGGKLCTWDEYVAGCTLAGAQLGGLFDEWEWIDDTSNHTHTADQAGRFTCQSQRTANAITLIVGDTRCCYHPR